MKLTIRIPTVTYGYIEATFDSLEELQKNYKALRAEQLKDINYKPEKEPFQTPTELADGTKLLRN